MLAIIFLVLVLLVVQAMIPAAVRTQAFGQDVQMGPQDTVPELPVRGQRAQRALRNFQETLPVFLTLGVLHVVYGQALLWGVIGGLVYLVARIAYLYLYLEGVPRWRSQAWGVALLGLIIMAIPLLQYVF